MRGCSDAFVNEDAPNAKVILQNFKLENLENLKASGARPAIGNILFNGQTSITDSFNVLDANSTDTSLGIKNTVTFLNDLSNNITGLDNSDDVINGQGGNDKIDGKSGDDLLRGGTGNDTLMGCVGNDTLIGSAGNDSLVGSVGNDNLNVNYSQGNSLLSGGDGNDSLLASGDYNKFRGEISFGNPISGNNTLNGGAGKDILNANYSTGNNILNGDAGDDRLNIDYSTGNNLLSGGTGNDYLSVSGLNDTSFGYDERFYGSGSNTLNGGTGDDSLSFYGRFGIATFAFNSFNEGVDRFDGFNTTNELIQVSADGFGGGLSSGSLKASQFTLGTSATTNTQRFIYNSATGGLFFDQDGSASGFTQVQFAQLSGGVALTESSLVVV